VPHCARPAFASERLTLTAGGQVSNYNTRPRAAEVQVRGDSFQVIRRRETIDQLLAKEEPLPA
jgi:hypothetical protein